MPPANLLDSTLSMLLVLLAAGGYLLIRGLVATRTERIARRARDITGVAHDGGRAVGQGEASSLQQTLQRLGSTLVALPLSDARQRRKMSELLIMAGLRSPQALLVLFASKYGLGLIGCIGGYLLARHSAPGMLFTLLLLVGGLVAGMALPEIVLNIMVRRRKRIINRFLPDALDLLIICTNAGYGLGASMARVAHDITPLCPALGSELQLTSDEMQIMAEPSAALQRLAARTRLEAVRSLTSTLIQTQRYGTPLSHSLKTLVDSERKRRMLRMEEKAAKLSVKLTIPMMVFILPTVLIIAGGPAAINLVSALSLFSGRN